MYRGFLICPKALVSDKCTLIKLYPEEFYKVDQDNEYYVVTNKETESISSPDFFHIPFESKIKTYVYGYITSPFEIDSRIAGDEKITVSYFSHNRNQHYFINKSHELNGSFTLINIFDNEKIEIFSDRLGTRPVYYSKIKGLWIISSTGGLLIPLIRLYRRNRPNFIAFTSLLLRSRPIDRMTLIEDVFRTDAGEVITLLPSESEKRRKWYKPIYTSHASGMSLNEKLEELDKALDRSAERLSHITYRPLLFLSGGMDSRLAAVILKEKLENLDAMTLSDNINTEARIARRVARELKLNHRYYIRDKYYYFKNLETFVVSCLGSYFYVHGHFSKALEEFPCYSDIYLGDFLESIKKLIGFRTDKEEIIKVPDDIVSNIFLIDGYSSKLGYETLNIFSAPYREQFREEYFKALTRQAEEAFNVSDEIAIIVDYFLRWRRAYEISTFGMFEDLRLIRPDKNIAWDNEFISILLKLNTIDRTKAKLGIKLLQKRNKNLVMKIPDANTLIPPGHNDYFGKLFKNIRNYGAFIRRQFLTMIDKPPISGMHSWQNADYLNVSDPNWKNYLQENILSKTIADTEQFDTDFIKYSWHKYCQYDFRYGYIIYSLLNYSILMRL